MELKFVNITTFKAFFNLEMTVSFFEQWILECSLERFYDYRQSLQFYSNIELFKLTLNFTDIEFMILLEPIKEIQILSSGRVYI